MAEIKTKVTDADPRKFIQSVENETRRRDGLQLLDMFTRITGETPKMWGPSMIGFGQYHYKSERSSQEGDWPLVAFSPRKANLTLYVMNDDESLNELLAILGKHKSSVGCLYINKLSDVDINVLEQIIDRSYKHSKATLT